MGRRKGMSNEDLNQVHEVWRQLSQDHGWSDRKIAEWAGVSREAVNAVLIRKYGIRRR